MFLETLTRVLAESQLRGNSEVLDRFDLCICQNVSKKLRERPDKPLHYPPYHGIILLYSTMRDKT